jgi:RHS repeat-associated protein
VATTEGGALLSTQDFTPWGETRSGGISQTTLNYTGQRRDGTGLLFYHARYYDPATARFLSPDSIGVAFELPQTWNRYSYVSNNPIKYTDPTGHCTANPTTKGDIEENDRCTNYAEQLKQHGIEVQNLWDWLSGELGLMLQGVQDIRKVANWTPEDFARAMGGVDLVRGACGGPNCNWYGVHYSGGWQRSTIVMFDLAFNSGAATAMYTIVHELAHVWDYISGRRLSNGLMRSTGGTYSCNLLGKCKYNWEGKPASEYAKGNQREDWAESVAATVYPTYERFTDRGVNRMDDTRRNFVQNQFAWHVCPPPRTRCGPR